MQFKSDAELVRHYFGEFMADGRERSIHEVLAYVLQRHGNVGVNGKTITYNKVQNVLFQFVRSKNSGYMMAGRGHYVKEAIAGEPQVAPFDTLASVCDSALRILHDAEIDVRNCFMSYLSIMKDSGDVNFSLRDTEQTVVSLLEQSMRKIKDLRTYQGNTYFAPNASAGFAVAKNCKVCGSRMVWENPNLRGHFHESSCNLADWDICHDCMVDHCVKTDCADCNFGKLPECRFHSMKINYMED